jgi:osmoprotectant transport system permease protein
VDEEGLLAVDFLGQVLEWFADSAQWRGDDGIPHRLVEHMAMSAAAVGVAALVALPVGLVLGHTGRGGGIAINVSNIGRAVPSFAVIIVAAQVFGIGATPAFVALVLLALPPMVTNTYTAIHGVDPDLREAASGMGMTGAQLLARVELPVGLPLIMAGIRTSAVQVVATATLAAVTAWGGLGRFIVDGFAQRDDVQVFAGALLVALLAIVTELAVAGLQRLVVPAGLRTPETRVKDTARLGVQAA